MTDEEQPSDEPSTGEQLPNADQPAFTQPVIEDERIYSTHEAGDLLGLHWRTVISHIKRGRIAAERRIERRGPTYDILGSEIKRFQRERRPPGSPGKQSETKSEPPHSAPTPEPVHKSANDTDVQLAPE